MSRDLIRQHFKVTEINVKPTGETNDRCSECYLGPRQFSILIVKPGLCNNLLYLNYLTTSKRNDL